VAVDPFIHLAEPGPTKWAVALKQAVRQFFSTSWLPGVSRIKS
jgi:hypothetical protein